MLVHYFMVVGQVGENRVLSEENSQLRTQLKLVHERVAHISQTLDRVERFDQKLRALTQLNDPERNLAIGPLPSDERSQGDEDPDEAAFECTGGASRRTPPSCRASSTAWRSRPRGDEQSYPAARPATSRIRKSLLASTPSIWPARGWVTSDFGIRTDPYTSERSMHRGLDIANEIGTPVFAPSDGVVIFDGTEGGYGNVLVLDHGYGVRTRYGHLNKILVKLGDKVKRGQQVAAVGNTGRSTGPHLHYEVRINGIPENPRKFILE